MLDREAFGKLQSLAKLRLDREEADLLRTQLEAILHHMRRLDELDLEGVPPMTHPATAATPLRPDEPSPGLTLEEAVGGAPDHEGGLVGVPRVLKGEPR